MTTRKTTYAAMYDEVFVGFGKHVNENVLELGGRAPELAELQFEALVYKTSYRVWSKAADCRNRKQAQPFTGQVSARHLKRPGG